jgi:hypothetical protein
MTTRNQTSMTNDEIRARYVEVAGQDFQATRTAYPGDSWAASLLTLAIVAAIVLGLLLLSQTLTIFEDGSFIMGPVNGCLPFALCQ